MYIKAINKKLAFSLIEVMISALILSISLLGAASLQSKGLFSIVESGRQEAAMQMINQLTTFALTADVSNPTNPVNFQKMIDNSISQTNANIALCYSTAGCSEDKFYIATVSEWQSLLSTLLPNGQGCTCLVQTTGFTTSSSPQPATIRVAVNWKNLSNRISTVSMDTQVSSAIIPPTNNIVFCPSTTPLPFTITSNATQICNNNV